MTFSLPSLSPMLKLPSNNDDGNGNENGTENNVIGLEHHVFLYIFLPLLHDYDVKVPNFTFCGGREHRTTTSFFYSTSVEFRIHLEFNFRKIRPHLTN